MPILNPNFKFVVQQTFHTNFEQDRVEIVCSVFIKIWIGFYCRPKLFFVLAFDSQNSNSASICLSSLPQDDKFEFWNSESRNSLNGAPTWTKSKNKFTDAMRTWYEHLMTVDMYEIHVTDICRCLAISHLPHYEPFTFYVSDHILFYDTFYFFRIRWIDLFWYTNTFYWNLEFESWGFKVQPTLCGIQIKMQNVLLQRILKQKMLRQMPFQNPNDQSTDDL